MIARGRLRAGETILIAGATGKTGLAAVQVARMLGASRVVGTVRTKDKADAAMALGLDRVVVADEFPEALRHERFDLVIDPVGGAQRIQTLDLIAPHGRMLVVGSAAADDGALVDTNRIWTSNIGILGFSAGFALRDEPERGVAAGRVVLPLIADGRLALPVSVLPLSQAAHAHVLMDERQVTGRLVLDVA